MVHWFGAAPWGPALEPKYEHVRAARIPVPVGQPCYTCREPIEEGDDGEMVVALGGGMEAPTAQSMPQHRECSILRVVGHELGVCGCTGYEGLALREAGIEAARRLELHRVGQWPPR